jgi:hypothetical protein
MMCTAEFEIVLSALEMKNTNENIHIKNKVADLLNATVQ